MDEPFDISPLWNRCEKLNAAASVMLAALEAAETTLNNGAPITAGTRYNMRSAIAAAKAAGIKSEG